MDRVWFITGASSGFGRALAEAVLKRGDSAVICGSAGARAGLARRSNTRSRRSRSDST